jgi:hypothetical protein
MELFFLVFLLWFLTRDNEPTPFENTNEDGEWEITNEEF